ncbi:MAG: hypothetical protein QXL89_08995 [Nitrososphaeria archaeon]
MVEEPTNNKTPDVGEKDLPSVGQLEQTLSVYNEVRAAVDGFFKDKIEAIEGAIEAQKKAEEAKKKNNNYMHLELPKPKENDKVGPYVWLFRELIKTEVGGFQEWDTEITNTIGRLIEIECERILKTRCEVTRKTIRETALKVLSRAYEVCQIGFIFHKTF